MAFYLDNTKSGGVRTRYFPVQVRLFLQYKETVYSQEINTAKCHHMLLSHGIKFEKIAYLPV